MKIKTFSLEEVQSQGTQAVFVKTGKKDKTLEEEMSIEKIINLQIKLDILLRTLKYIPNKMMSLRTVKR
eukprot:gene15253-16824_t